MHTAGRAASSSPAHLTLQLPRPPAACRPLQKHISSLTFVDASALNWPVWQPPLEPDEEGWRQKDGWRFKAFVLWAAPYQEVLFLDSDATAAIDPVELFEDSSYRRRGSLFWPELWCGDSGLFQALEMPSIGEERQTESGMVLVDRRRHWAALEWALWLNMNDNITYSLTCEGRRALLLAAAWVRVACLLAQLPRGLLSVADHRRRSPLLNLLQTATRTRFGRPSSWPGTCPPSTRSGTLLGSCWSSGRCEREGDLAAVHAVPATTAGL